MEGSLKNGHSHPREKVLVYLGPSLSLDVARDLVPGAIFKPPAKQADLTSDLVNLNPNIIILIDGEFAQNLSTWHKEWIYALQYPSVKKVLGASSIGALRAAELEHLGMIGVGQIFRWYRGGVVEDDSEVALSYSIVGDSYHPLTVPLVDIRAGVEHYEREFPGEPVALAARRFLGDMAGVYYLDRTSSLCADAWNQAYGVPFPRIEQKALDAVEVLSNYHTLQSGATQKPTPDDLTVFFKALYERDRRISINGTEIQQQHLDAYVLLHNVEYERICWDAANQELALILCDQLQVHVSVLELERESQRFQARAGIKTETDFNCFLENNGWTRHEYDRVMIQNARVRKLQHAATVAKQYRRNTQSIIDYLRTHQAFDYWAVQAAQAEAGIKKSGVDDWLGIDIENPTMKLLHEHFEKEGLELNANGEEYLLETGFSNFAELGVALARTAAGKEHNG
jgi:hypothetical protein